MRLDALGTHRNTGEHWRGGWCVQPSPMVCYFIISPIFRLFFVISRVFTRFSCVWMHLEPIGTLEGGAGMSNPLQWYVISLFHAFFAYFSLFHAFFMRLDTPGTPRNTGEHWRGGWHVQPSTMLCYLDFSAIFRLFSFLFHDFTRFSHVWMHLEALGKQEKQIRCNIYILRIFYNLFCV